MLDHNLKAQLKGYFEKIVHPIVLTASLDSNPASAEMLELLNEVAEQSDNVTVVTNGSAAHTPSFTVGKVGDDARITFSGLPMGHEMTSFILAILQASGYPPKVEQEIIERIVGWLGDPVWPVFLGRKCCVPLRAASAALPLPPRFSFRPAPRATLRLRRGGRSAGPSPPRRPAGGSVAQHSHGARTPAHSARGLAS
jgi:hypothetical protein